MKKELFSIAVAAAAVSGASAQGLYNIGLGDDEAGESLPLRWTVGASVGYDDNASPIGSECVEGDDSLYVSGYVQANYIQSTPKTTLDIWARVGVIHYLDDISPTNGSGLSFGSADDTFVNLRAGVNYTNRISERLRFSSRNWVSYELEPDYDFGFATDRRVGQYLNYSTDNSIGYRWSERFGTIAGYRLNGVTFDDFEGNDRQTHTFYLQGRYRLSPSTVATAGYRYSWTDGDAGDSEGRSIITGGLERRFSPNTVGVIRAGVSIGDSTSPFVEGSFNTQVTDQLGIRAFVNYRTDNFNRRIGTTACSDFVNGLQSSVVYGETDTLRFGLQANYSVNPRLTLTAGLNYINTRYSDAQSGVGNNQPSSLDEDLFNANVGFNMRLTDALSVNGSYNYSTSSSDSDIREYDRNRFQVGVSATF